MDERGRVGAGEQITSRRLTELPGAVIRVAAKKPKLNIEAIGSDGGYGARF